MAMHATNKLIVSGNSRVYNKEKEHTPQKAWKFEGGNISTYEELMVILTLYLQVALLKKNILLNCQASVKAPFYKCILKTLKQL